MIAVQFLTTLPIHGNHVREDKDLGRSMMFYPIVGLFMGAITLAIYKLVSYFFLSSVSLVIATIASIVLTGGLHIDGFADMCDGFYAGQDKTGILTIMKDSHIGTMAVIGVFCLLLLKLSLLASLLSRGKLMVAFLIVPSISRWVMTVVAASYPYARAEGGTAKPFVQNAGPTEISLSSVFILIISYFLAGPAGILISFLTVGIALLIMIWVKRKIGGITGDVLGGMNEISEVSALLILNLAYPILRTGWAT